MRFELAPTSFLCRDVVFRRVFQCEVDWSFAELLLVALEIIACSASWARCDDFLIRLSFLCRVTKCVSHVASLSREVSPPHFASGATNMGFEGISVEHFATKVAPVHQNCRCLCLSRTHPHRSKQHAQTRISVGWATGRQHFKSDYAWSTSSLHTCLLSVSTLCDFRAAIWNNSPQKKNKNLKMIHFRFRVSRHYL